MYDQNLISWFKTELDGIVDSTIDKSKITSDDRFFRVFITKKAKIIRDYDFTELSIPKDYLELPDSQKESIRELMTVWHDNIFYEDYLRLICRVGYCYERNQLTDTPEYQAILANYQFLKQLWQQAYPTSFSEFEAEKLTIHTPNQQPQQLRPSCIECGSTDIVSREPNWHCKSCGRQWLKKPRRQNLTINQP